MNDDTIKYYVMPMVGPFSNTLWDKTVLISFSFALVRRISAFVS
jgi:hypothetical protein